MKKNEWCWLLPWLLPWMLGGLSILMVPVMGRAQTDGGSEYSITLNAGETHVINHLSPDATPGIRVIDNPHALVVHSEVPGELVLLGAEAGRWAIHVKLLDGKSATYDVQVKQVADFRNRLTPVAAPPPSADAGFSADSGGTVPPAKPTDAAPVTVSVTSPAGEAGSGAVASAAEPGTKATTGTSTGTTTAAASAAEGRAGGLSEEPVGIIATASVAGSSASGGGPPSAIAGAAPAASTTATTATGTTSELPSAAATGVPALSSQAASAAAQIPISKFRSDPAAGEASLESPVRGTYFLPDDAISLMASTSRVFQFAQRIRRVSLADTKIADVQVVSPHQLVLTAHQPGFTTLAVWDDQGRYEERQVRVDLSGKQQVMLSVILAELNRSNLENQGIDYSAALTNLGLSLVGLPGFVATPFTATAGGAGLHALPPGGSIIPMLLSNNITYGIAGQNSNVQTQALFHFLEQHDLARILAQPQLLANSGEKATFLSGGEIPIVIAQALNTSVVFKQFGTSVTFLPTVVGRSEIELVVKPEVSKPDFTQGVQLFGFTVPAFVTRRAETFVRLHNNQTLIIAGLILHDKRSVVDKVPYLGDIPLAGALFRNTSYQNVETDLVMSVTPQIVQPLPPGGEVQTPSSVPFTGEDIRTRRVYPPDVSRPRF